MLNLRCVECEPCDRWKLEVINKASKKEITEEKSVTDECKNEKPVTDERKMRNT